MAKKKSVASLFETARTKTDKEILSAIKRYCMKVTENDVEEIHQNIVENFELKSSSDSKYFELEVFSSEILIQQDLKKSADKQKK
jgi:hypothetical protein